MPTSRSGLAARHPDWEIIALDNLRRRGSELNLPRLREAGIAFAHGDVRVLDDLLAIGEIDALVECSAEPSALAGVDGSPDYVVQSNLIGAYHCLELARRRGGLRAVPLDQPGVPGAGTRRDWRSRRPTPGLS